MTPLFGKKSKKNTVPVEETWSVFRGRNDDKDIVLRLNTGYVGKIMSATHPYQVGVTTGLRTPTENGTPSAEENAELQAIEDLIESRFGKNKNLLFVAAICTGDTKELIYYTNDPVHVYPALEKVRDDISTHEVRTIMQLDEGWSVYRHFAEMAGL